MPRWISSFLVVGAMLRVVTLSRVILDAMGSLSLRQFSARAFYAAMVLGASNGTLATAKAQEWERLPDGRAVINVKGTAVAFPSAGPELRDAKFDLSNERNLKWVIESPLEARQFFERSKQVLISIPNLSDREGLFLGRFQRSELQGVSFSLAIGEKSQGNCRAWERTYDQYRASRTSETPPANSDGWIEFETKGSPKYQVYLRARDPGLTPKNLDAFSCTEFGFCAAAACIGSDKAFTYRFERTIHKPENWNALVQKSREVLRSILID